MYVHLCRLPSFPEGFSFHIVCKFGRIPSCPEGFSLSILHINLCRIPSGQEGFSFPFVCNFVPYPLWSRGVQLPFCIEICAVSPLALRASASILYVNLFRIPSCPGGFSFHFVYKFVPYPLLPRGVQLRHFVCKFVLNSLLPRGLQLPFCINKCAVSPLAQRASASILYKQMYRIPSCPESFNFHFVYNLCRIPFCPGGFMQLPFYM